MRAARRAKRDFRAQLRDEIIAAGMKARGRTYRLQKKDYRQGQFAGDKEAAKAIKFWKY